MAAAHLEELHRGFEIGLLGQLRLPGARRVTYDGSEMDHGFHAFKGPVDHFSVSYIALLELETGLRVYT